MRGGWLWLLICASEFTFARSQRCLLSIDKTSRKVQPVTESEPRHLAPEEAASLLGSSETAAEEDAASVAVLELLSNVPEQTSRNLCQLAADAGEAPLLHSFRGRPVAQTAKCAVVSNSGVLLSHKYGAEIDSADLVFRFNDAEIGGSLSEFVGERDDIRVLNHKTSEELFHGNMSFSQNTTYLLIRSKGGWEKEQLRAMPNPKSVWFPSDKVMSLALNLLNYKDFTLFGGPGGSANPTTGTLALLAALSVCDEVRAYGFAQSRASHTAPFHYYGELKTGHASQGHYLEHASSGEEKDIWQRLSVSSDATTTDVSVIPGFPRLQSCPVRLLSKSSWTKSAQSQALGAVCNFAALRPRALFEEFPQEGNHHRDRRASYPIPHARSCAVVSSSGTILKHHYGADIDSAELVFRFNDAEIGGEFEKYAGSRVDVRIMNRMNGNQIWIRNATTAPGVTYVLSRHTAIEEDSLLNATERAGMLLGTGKAEKVAMDMLHKAFAKSINGNPTTGFIGMLLAMSVCDEVRAYGFPMTPGAKDAPFHYYGWYNVGRSDRNFDHGEVAAFEKNFWHNLAVNSNVDESDVAILPGFSQLNCSAVPAEL
mmetsp:Transcript_46429/g.110631  ORF Transcript_46429/g.110631 Transcript_46429/m.110631 type:complete len:597 (+) Transcript_46429:111-1901(+)